MEGGLRTFPRLSRPVYTVQTRKKKLARLKKIKIFFSLSDKHL
jgi:hypothetical protein